MRGHDAWISAATLEDPEIAPTVRLVPLGAEHAAGLHAAADRELFRHSAQGPADWTVRGFAEDIERVRSLPGVVPFAIVRVGGSAGPDAEVIGRTTFMDIRPEHRGLEIGRTWISRPFHGTEVNPSIKFLMLRHAFERLSPAARRVQFCTGSSNEHSQRAIARLGATREGVLRHARILPPWLDRAAPEVLDTVVFSILAAEWPAARERLVARLRLGAGRG